MSALTTYNNQMVLPSIDAFLKLLEGEKRALFDRLKRLFVLNIDVAQAATRVWLTENMSVCISVIISIHR